ncbi:hypothetical protein DRW07_14755 [Alteromonas sediminis]|uniref:Lytic murein transglycosylase n=1 Tax=Alteromonas sediminis TaxID=2259342 RepID=A0A3N5XY40_9ALTE|nr:transglycosylase SLT domain-containing protein [Alteromonas sediminis]RPJ66057.1 hypothetical protein DRW07_14755 [Alteromonas sediminis]
MTTQNLLVTFIILLIGSTFHNPSYAQDTSLEAQRERYAYLQKRIRSVPVSRLHTLEDDVQDMASYPLFPYLYYELVNRQVSYNNRKQIRAFLRDTKGVPVRRQLLRKWLRYLAKHHYQTVFLQEYEPGLGTELLCRQLHFTRKKHGADAAWHEQVEVLWLAGFSQPEACDPVLHYWRTNGKLTSELAIQRIGLAGEQGKTGLTRYLRRYAPENARFLSDKWVDVHRNSATVLSPRSLPFTLPEQERKIAKWGLNKASWRIPERVATNLPIWEASGKLPQNDLQSITETLAISLTLDAHPSSQQWLERASTANAGNNVWRWHLAHVVKQQQWKAVLDVVEQAPVSVRETGEFRYWNARALESVGRIAEANNIMTALATERHYYGFLASAKRAVAPSYNLAALAVDEQVYNNIMQHPQAQRARELFYHKEYTPARREWYALNRELNVNEKRAAVKLASEWGWHDQAIVGVLRTGDRDAVDLRFPLAFADEMVEQANRYNVEPAFSLAIARRESSFMVDAVSSANARGLMQVLPSTATYLVKHADVLSQRLQRKLDSGPIQRYLFNPETNIELGLGYLKYLEQKLGTNPVLIAAAYNAGWHKVIEWLPRDKPVPMDIWIDNIPFKETREYVKAVMAYQQIYEWQLGHNSHLFANLSAMQVPVYTQ